MSRIVLAFRSFFAILFSGKLPSDIAQDLGFSPQRKAAPAEEPHKGWAHGRLADSHSRMRHSQIIPKRPTFSAVSRSTPVPFSVSCVLTGSSGQPKKGRNVTVKSRRCYEIVKSARVGTFCAKVSRITGKRQGIRVLQPPFDATCTELDQGSTAPAIRGGRSSPSIPKESV